MKPPKVTYTDRGLPYLDQAVLDFIFDGVYGLDLEQVKDERFRGFLNILYQMQDYNYRHRFEAFSEMFSIFEETVGPMERNSEGTSFWLALGLALKEWYGLSRATLRQVMEQVTVRK